jgi:hypothetical protein
VQQRPAAERVWPGVALCVCGLVGAVARVVEMTGDGETDRGWIGLVAFALMALAGAGGFVAALRARRRSAEAEAGARSSAG